jgi:TolA-binding protein
VAREAAAQRRLESALKLVRRKLREVKDRYPGTRAARIASVQLAALEP